MRYFLKFNKNGHIPSATKYPPALDVDEIYIEQVAEIPDALFERPLIKSTITVTEDAVQKTIITPEILLNTQRSIEQETGMRVQLLVVEQEPKVDE